MVLMFLSVFVGVVHANLLLAIASLFMGISESRAVGVIWRIYASARYRPAQERSTRSRRPAQISLPSLGFTECVGGSVTHQAISIAAVLALLNAQPDRHRFVTIGQYLERQTCRGSVFVTNSHDGPIFKQSKVTRIVMAA